MTEDEKQGEDSRDQHSKQKNEQEKRSTSEVVVLIFCIAVVAFLLGYSLYTGVTTAGDVPRINAIPQFDNVTQHDNKYILPIEVENTNGPTVEDVTVKAVFMQRGQEVETQEITISYLPGNARLRGYVVFQREPTSNNVQVLAGSYKTP